MNPNAVWVCEIETKRAREWSTQRENLEADTHDSQLLLQDPKLHGMVSRWEKETEAFREWPPFAYFSASRENIMPEL
ncbi:hypothetical protein VitviT2T_029514 [Vitis vinifera]|uniref:Uncharacterized protein n=1 Tax=Vitis vinifera TaxID=29760 RepID=A0ABY9DZT8_VITVI|nr:hypothetical protein VitviT2T_029514 [Vitis vinifera]